MNPDSRPLDLDACATHAETHPLEAPAAHRWAATPLPSTAWQGFGLPQHRHARVAARRAFVALQQQFQRALAPLTGARGDWLRRQVTGAEEMIDLWLLRGPVVGALDDAGETTLRQRRDLAGAIDAAFPNHGHLLPYGVRPDEPAAA